MAKGSEVHDVSSTFFLRHLFYPHAIVHPSSVAVRNPTQKFLVYAFNYLVVCRGNTILEIRGIIRIPSAAK